MKKWRKKMLKRAQNRAVTREKLGGGSHTEWVDRITKLYGWDCWLCGRPIPPTKVTLDHLVPKCFGGRHSLKNLRPAHSKCNQLRGCMPVSEARTLLRILDPYQPKDESQHS